MGDECIHNIFYTSMKLSLINNKYFFKEWGYKCHLVSVRESYNDELRDGETNNALLKIIKITS